MVFIIVETIPFNPIFNRPIEYGADIVVTLRQNSQDILLSMGSGGGNTTDSE